MQLSDIVLFGISHKTAPLKLREKVALNETVCLQGMGHLIAAGMIAEIVIYSTCNRLEFLYVAHDRAKARTLITHFLKAHTAVSDAEIAANFYTKTGLEAVKHLFCVAASLDSMVVGEPQILGQLKQAYSLAVQARSTGVVLNRLLHKTFFAAKKVRTQTNIGGHAVSISHAAVNLAKKEFADLSACNVLLIGAGEMGAIAAQKVAQYNPQQFFIANRTHAKARGLALNLNGESIAWDNLALAVEKVDLIISSAVCNRYILWYNDLLSRKRPLVIIDIGVPRSVDPAINSLPGCTVYDLDDIQHAVEQNIRLRHGEVEAAATIVNDEVLAFERWFQGLELKPTILALRAKLNNIVTEELAKAQPNSPDTAQIAKAVVNRFLHDPTQCLKALSHEKSQDLYLDVMRRLFDLDT